MATPPRGIRNVRMRNIWFQVKNGPKSHRSARRRCSNEYRRKIIYANDVRDKVYIKHTDVFHENVRARQWTMARWRQKEYGKSEKDSKRFFDRQFLFKRYLFDNRITINHRWRRVNDCRVVSVWQNQLKHRSPFVFRVIVVVFKWSEYRNIRES